MDITVQELQGRLEANDAVVVLDVRTAVEFREVHIEHRGVESRPLEFLKPTELAYDKEIEIIVLCRSGNRSNMAQNSLAKAGFTNVLNVNGGMLAWEDAALPVKRGKKAGLPLDRQMRIIIGFAVVLGAVLAHFVHPQFIWLSGFFGAGLMMAGLTNFCPLAIVVARMPWNQVKGVSCCSTQKP